MIRAVFVNAFGLAQLSVSALEKEALGPQDVRIKLAAVSLNYRDYMMLMGWYNPRLSLPLVPCSDGAGSVLEVGSAVSGLVPGDRVCSTMLPDWCDGPPLDSFLKSSLGGPLNGLLAQERVLPQRALFKLPDGMSFEEGACLPVAGLTAWCSLHCGGHIGRKSRILLLGTGGVSIMALTIARKMGAEVVITSSSDEKLAKARSLGATHTLNYRTHESWSKQVRAFYETGVDLVLEVGGDGTFDQSVKSVRNGGTVALIGVLAHKNKAVNLTQLLMHQIRVQGILVGSRESFLNYLNFVERECPTVVIDRVFQGLESAPDAFKYLASGAHFGKIVIKLAD